MVLTGYEDEPLVDGSAFLDEPVFWAVHAMASGVCERNDLEGRFGVDVDDAEELCERLFDHDRWPVFTVSLPSGASVHVVYRNLDEDMGLDYVLSHPGWTRDLVIAAVDGCFVGPGLSWGELAVIADRSAMGPLEAAHRLLLLLPALGDADLPESAVGAVAAALAETARCPDPGAVADLLLFGDGAYWEPPRWTRLADGAIVCGGEHSVRTPEYPDALAITRALGGT